MRSEDPASGQVEVTYSAPWTAQAGDSVNWGWTVRNTGDKAVDGVVLVHRLTPQLKIGKVSKECEALAAEIRCSYGSLQPGATSSGELTATVPLDATGTVQVDGTVTWQPAGAVQPGADALAGAAAPKVPAALDAVALSKSPAVPNGAAEDTRH
ncbi:DUF11 domain-containing protein [Actinomadura harenae]|uniref:DUF11 domain-containing protein n=1 Tax=Actinomadura harenae TaxID=2483351 RepID=A0A3M2LN87_9ACTN|nr:DUF11 domain-containing protein [Actinomadura harenae]RMI37545.1 hypothetical protein EBO15_35520 [Actinomadura harenae]